jgi:hypothetical protein
MGYSADWPNKYRQRLQDRLAKLESAEEPDIDAIEITEQAIEEARDLRYIHHYYKDRPLGKRISGWMRSITKKPKGVLGRKIPSLEKAEELGLERAPLAVSYTHMVHSVMRAEEAARLLATINDNPNMSAWESDPHPEDWRRLDERIIPDSVQRQQWVDKEGKIGMKRRHKVYAPPIADAIEELTYVGSPHLLTRTYDRFNNAMKIIGFYNPFIMTQYNIHQAWRAAGHKPFVNLPKAMNVWVKKGPEYHRLRKMGLFNNVISIKPMATDHAEKMLDQIRLTYGEKAAKMAGEWLNPVNIVKDLRKFNDYTTWNMDEIMRIATYYGLKGTATTKGMSDFEVAELANDFLANYGKMPKRTRQVLNRVWFTPTYKISMARVLAKMWSQPWRYKGPLLRHYGFKLFLWAGLPAVVTAGYKKFAGKDVDVELEKGYRLVIRDPDKKEKDKVIAISSPLLEDTKMTQRAFTQSIGANLSAGLNVLVRVMGTPRFKNNRDKYGEFFKLGTPVYRDIVNWVDKDKATAEKFLTQFAIGYVYYRSPREKDKEKGFKHLMQAMSLWADWKAQVQAAERMMDTRFVSLMDDDELRSELSKNTFSYLTSKGKLSSNVSKGKAGRAHKGEEEYVRKLRAEIKKRRQELSLDCIKYFDGKFEELEKRIDLMNTANKTALEVADRELERRLEGMNEFRAQLTRQASQFLTQDVHKKDMELITGKVESNTKLLYIGLGILAALQFVFKFVG